MLQTVDFKGSQELSLGTEIILYSYFPYLLLSTDACKSVHRTSVDLWFWKAITPFAYFEVQYFHVGLFLSADLYQNPKCFGVLDTEYMVGGLESFGYSARTMSGSGLPSVWLIDILQYQIHSWPSKISFEWTDEFSKMSQVTQGSWWRLKPRLNEK